MGSKITHSTTDHRFAMSASHPGSSYLWKSIKSLLPVVSRYFAVCAWTVPPCIFPRYIVPQQVLETGTGVLVLARCYVCTVVVNIVARVLTTQMAWLLWPFVAIVGIVVRSQNDFCTFSCSF